MLVYYLLKVLDARKEATREEARLVEVEKEASRTRHEQNEKARMRGKHALEKEELAQNYQKTLVELSLLQKADLEKRQKELGNIPV